MNQLSVMGRAIDARGARDQFPVRLTPELERAAKEKYLPQVQSLAKRELTPDDFHVRGMRVCNSQRDYYYSRFSLAALDEIVEMIPGAPVLRNHNYAHGDPVGTFFSARRVRIEDANLPKRDQYWVEALYYVPRDDQGDAIVRRVDLGNFREVSIGWRCVGAACSICREPIWTCAHIPGDLYDRSEKRSGMGICEYEFSGVTSVLEVSHVFRGGQKDTSTFVPEGADGGAVQAAASRAAFEGCVTTGELRALKRAFWAENASRYRSMHGGRAPVTLEELLGEKPANTRAVGWGTLFAERGERDNTQSIRIAKSRFTSVANARRWARDHDFRVDAMREDGNEYVFPQFPESYVESGSLRSIRLEDGIVARAGRVLPKEQRPKEAAREVDDADDTAETLEQWLAQEATGSSL